MAGRFGRHHRLRARREFQLTLRRGQRARGAHLSVAVAAGRANCPRLGLAVSKGAGNSPQRARLKRLLREAFRGLRDRWPPLDLVAMCRQPWPGATMAEVAQELDQLVSRARRQRRRKERR